LVHPALRTDSADDVAGLVTELDELYFALSVEQEAGRASLGEVDAAFGRARAANAVEFMLRAEPAEAIYEAAASTEDWSELRSSVLSLLGATNDASP